MRAIWDFLRRNEHGQDLAEYCLITAFIAIVALGIFIHVSGGMQSIWGTADSTLATTNTTSPPGAATPAVASSSASH